MDDTKGEKKYMRRLLMLLLSGAFLLLAVGCGEVNTQETGLLTTTTTTTATTIASSATTTTTSTVTTTTATVAVTTHPHTFRTTTICPTRPPVNTTTTTAPVEPPTVETLTKWELPQVVRQTEGYISQYTDMTYTADGRIIAIGEVYDAAINPKTVIDVYGSDLSLLASYECDVWYSDIVTSQDGGTVVARGNGASTVKKFSADFELEWSVEFEEYAFDVIITSLVELSDGTVGVLYAKPFDSTWNLLWVSKDGQQLDKLSLWNYDVQNGLAYGAKLVADNNGGFYLFQTVTADTHSVDADKGYEVLVSHYVSENGVLRLDSSAAVGSVSDEWCDDAAVDDEGNYYIALSSSDSTRDAFWDEILPLGYGYIRRMLVKVSPTGEILYRVPLSGCGMAVDQVAGIHVRDGRVCVGGLSVFYDGVLDPNVAEFDNNFPRDLYVAYTVCADAEGDILSRRVFRYNVMERGAPTDALWLPDGRMVLCGSVTKNDSDFDLEFEPEYAYGTPADRALFVYQPLENE